MIFFRQNVQVAEGQARPRRRVGCLGGCLIFFAVYFICSAILGWIMGDMFSSGSVKLEDKTVYRLELKGELVEQAQEENPFAGLMGEMPYVGNRAKQETVGLDNILSNIRLAKNDDKILGIWLDDAQLAMAPASAKAIRDALLDFKQSGKWIIASAKNYGETNYYVASVADRICLDPTGAVAWHGLVAQKMYYTRLFEKIGVKMNILKVGTFKSAVEPFFRTSMSEADKMQTKQYLDGIWSEYKQAVGASRHLTVEQLDALADRVMGLQSAEENLKAGKYYVYELTGPGGTPVESEEGGIFNNGKYYDVTTTGSQAVVNENDPPTVHIINNYETTSVTATKTWAEWLATKAVV